MNDSKKLGKKAKYRLLFTVYICRPIKKCLQCYLHCLRILILLLHWYIFFICSIEGKCNQTCRFFTSHPFLFYFWFIIHYSIKAHTKVFVLKIIILLINKTDYLIIDIFSIYPFVPLSMYTQFYFCISLQYSRFIIILPTDKENKVLARRTNIFMTISSSKH